MAKKSIKELSAIAEKLQLETKNKHTSRAYDSDFSMFEKWCIDHDVCALPASAGTIAAYCVDRSSSAAISTISRSVSAIVAKHKAQGYTIGDRSPINEQLKALKKKYGVAQKQVKPICKEQLFQLLDSLGPDVIDRRDAAILAIGWACALRRSEICALNRGDLEFGPQGLTVTIRRSKTDQEGQGFKLAIPFISGGKNPCLVSIVDRWVKLQEDNWKIEGDKQSDPLFHGLNRSHKRAVLWVIPGAVKRLNDRAVSRIVKKVLESAGYSPEGFSGHSLRAGFITSCAAAGVPEWAIKRRSRHTSSATMEKYIRIGELFAPQNPLNLLLGDGKIDRAIEKA